MRGCGRGILLFCIAGVLGASADAVSLGPLRLHSALNQPLSADINVSRLGDIRLGELRASLASADAFDNVGMDRPHFLSELLFKVEQSKAHGPVIHVYSKYPVSEPFIQFLLDVSWPSGQLVREYTFLLDPPHYRYEDSTKPTASKVTKVTPPKSQTATKKTAIAKTTAKKPLRFYGPTKADDNLWRIAAKVRPDQSVTMEQVIYAIQQANPRAFMGRNVNRMQAGYRLRLPSKADIQKHSEGEALSALQQQNQAWSAFQKQRADQVDNKQPQLPSVESQVIQASYAASQSTQQKHELYPRAQLALSQVSHMPRITKVVPTVAPHAIKIVPADKVASDEANVLEQREVKMTVSEEVQSLRAALNMSAKQGQVVREANSLLTLQVSQLQQTNQALNDRISQLMEEINQLKQGVAAQHGSAASPASQDVSSEPHAAPNVLNNSGKNFWQQGFLIGIAALLVMVLGLWLKIRSSKAPEEEAEQALSAMAMADEEVASQVESHSEQIETGSEALQEDEPVRNILQEAEIYIAYGRFEEAQRELERALPTAEDPDAMRMMLLQVYGQTNNQDAFLAQAAILKANSQDERLAVKIAAFAHPSWANGHEGHMAVIGESEETLGDHEIEFAASEEDSIENKLNLARAYIEMREFHEASHLLSDVMKHGDEAQRQEAQTLLQQCT